MNRKKAVQEHICKVQLSSAALKKGAVFNLKFSLEPAMSLS